jgi:hypothetical protein
MVASGKDFVASGRRRQERRQIDQQRLDLLRLKHSRLDEQCRRCNRHQARIALYRALNLHLLASLGIHSHATS